MAETTVRRFSLVVVVATIGLLLIGLIQHLGLSGIATLLGQPGGQQILAMCLVGAVGLCEICTGLPESATSPQVDLQMALFPGMPTPIGLAPFTEKAE